MNRVPPIPKKPETKPPLRPMPKVVLVAAKLPAATLRPRMVALLAEEEEEANNTPLSTALNPQIVQAVGTTNHAVLNGAGPGANGIAYQKVAQAAAYAVQDSTDYMRNIMSMASATTGVALQKMLVEKTTDPYADIIKAATQAVTDAQQTFTNVGTASSGVVKDFDSMA